MNDHYTVQLLQLPQTIPSPLFERFLFNETHHIKGQAQPGDEILTFLLRKDDYTHARLTVFIATDQGMSPRRATFGGVESYPDIPAKALQFFLQEAVNKLRSKGLARLVIRSFPEGLNPALARVLHQAYLQAGFTVTSTELNQHLDVGQQNINLHDSTRRRLQKSLREGLVFEEWQSPDWTEVHAFIAAARKRKQRPMTMSLETLQASVTQLPGIFQVFTARISGKLAALTVTVRINDRILYTLYPADNPEFLSLSPLILVNAGIYTYCQNHRFQLLDLGISTENGIRNEGLIRFKKNLGAMESVKHSYELLFG